MICDFNYTLIHICMFFFLVAGYCAGQWYFWYIRLRKAYVTSNMRASPNGMAITPFIALDYFSRAGGRHRREVKVDTVNDKEPMRLRTRARARSQPSVNYARVHCFVGAAVAAPS